MDAARRRLHALLDATGARAFWGVGLGYLLPDALAVRLRRAARALARVDPDPPELILTAIAGGGVAAALALLALTVDETDEAFANVYSTAVSLQNVVPARLAAAADRRISAAVATVGALVIDLPQLPGLPLPARLVLRAAASACCSPTGSLAGAHYTREDVFDGPGRPAGEIAAWLVGFGLYQWLSPQGPDWWLDAASRHSTRRDRLHRRSLPSFAAAFALAALARLLARRAAGPRSPRR